MPEPALPDPSAVPEWKPAPTLALLTTLAFATRLGACLLKALVATDSYHYVRIARLILDGNWHDALAYGYHPAYPALSAALALVLRDVPFAAHAVSILLGSLAVLPAWSLGARAFGPRGAFFFALLVALHPEAVDVGSDILVESTFLFFFLASLAAALKTASIPCPGWGAAAGAFAAAAYLTRPEGLAAAALAPVLIVAAARIGPTLWPKRLAAAALAAAVFLAGFLPYAVWLHGHLGRWALTAKQGGEAFTRVAPQAKSGASEKKLEEKGKRSALFLPWYFGKEMAKTIYLPFLVLVLLYPMVPRGTPPERFARLALLAALAIYLPPLLRLLYAKGYLSTRHLLAPATLFLAFGAAAAARLSLRGRRAVPILVLLVAAAALPKSLRPDRREQIPLKQAGLLLRERAPGLPVMGPEKTAYYAGARLVHVPKSGAPDDIEAGLRAAGTPWLVLLEEDHPGIAKRLDPRFEPVAEFGEGEDRVAVFRLGR
ncbi:MAG: glycosyltransferase family 39 protein [Planctomycetes bacterium]|nr:glycosyltransferase family 39 protein [Planctomycetota bacterium]